LYIQFVAQGVVGVDQGIALSDGVIAFAGDVVKKLCCSWRKLGSRFLASSAGSAGICATGPGGHWSDDGD
jgi:hypothetical protein